MTVRSDFLDLDIDVADLSAAVSRLAGGEWKLVPLAVRCTYPVFRGESTAGEKAFVKIGSMDEWKRTATVLKEAGDCGYFAKLLVDTPAEYLGHALFLSEWKPASTVFPEDMDEVATSSFVEACGKMSAALQKVTDFTPIAGSPRSPEALYAELDGFCRRHRFAGRLLGRLRDIPEGERTFTGRPLGVVHGDFHAKNYGFDGGRFAAVFDFDKLTEGPACGDMVNALVERYSLLGMSRASRARLSEVTRRIVAISPWSREEMRICVNVLRLWFAANRIRKHPSSSWVALDIVRRDRRISEILEALV